MDNVVRTDACGRYTQVPTGSRPSKDWHWRWRVGAGMDCTQASVLTFISPKLFDCTGEIPWDLTWGFPIESPLMPIGDPHKLWAPFLGLFSIRVCFDRLAESVSLYFLSSAQGTGNRRAWYCTGYGIILLHVIMKLITESSRIYIHTLTIHEILCRRITVTLFRGEICFFCNYRYCHLFE